MTKLNKLAILESSKNTTAKNTANNSIYNDLKTRLTVEKTSDNVARIINKLMLELSLNDLTLINDQNIATRNAYALDKVTMILKSLRENKLSSAKMFQNYVVSIMRNMKRRRNKSVNNLIANCSISLSIENSDMKAKDIRLHKATSTSATQRSSTSIALHACDVVNYDTTNKTMTFKDNDNAKQMIELL